MKKRFGLLVLSVFLIAIGLNALSINFSSYLYEEYPPLEVLLISTGIHLAWAVGFILPGVLILKKIWKN